MRFHLGALIAFLLMPGCKTLKVMDKKFIYQACNECFESGRIVGRADADIRLSLKLVECQLDNTAMEHILELHLEQHEGYGGEESNGSGQKVGRFRKEAEEIAARLNKKYEDEIADIFRFKEDFYEMFPGGLARE